MTSEPLAPGEDEPGDEIALVPDDAIEGTVVPFPGVTCAASTAQAGVRRARRAAPDHPAHLRTIGGHPQGR